MFCSIQRFVLGACLLVPGIGVAAGKGMVDNGDWSERLKAAGVEGNNPKATQERRKKDRNRKLRVLDDADERVYPVQEEEPNH